MQSPEEFRAAATGTRPDASYVADNGPHRYSFDGFVDGALVHVVPAVGLDPAAGEAYRRAIEHFRQEARLQRAAARSTPIVWIVQVPGDAALLRAEVTHDAIAAAELGLEIRDHRAPAVPVRATPAGGWAVDGDAMLAASGDHAATAVLPIGRPGGWSGDGETYTVHLGRSAVRLDASRGELWVALHGLRPGTRLPRGVRDLEVLSLPRVTSVEATLDSLKADGLAVVGWEDPGVGLIPTTTLRALPLQSFSTTPSRDGVYLATEGATPPLLMTSMEVDRVVRDVLTLGFATPSLDDACAMAAFDHSDGGFDTEPIVARMQQALPELIAHGVACLDVAVEGGQRAPVDRSGLPAGLGDADLGLFAVGLMLAGQDGVPTELRVGDRLEVLEPTDGIVWALARGIDRSRVGVQLRHDAASVIDEAIDRGVADAAARLDALVERGLVVRPRAQAALAELDAIGAVPMLPVIEARNDGRGETMWLGSDPKLPIAGTTTLGAALWLAIAGQSNQASIVDVMATQQVRTADQSRVMLDELRRLVWTGAAVLQPAVRTGGATPASASSEVGAVPPRSPEAESPVPAAPTAAPPAAPTAAAPVREPELDSVSLSSFSTTGTSATNRPRNVGTGVPLADGIALPVGRMLEHAEGDDGIPRVRIGLGGTTTTVRGTAGLAWRYLSTVPPGTDAATSLWMLGSASGAGAPDRAVRMARTAAAVESLRDEGLVAIVDMTSPRAVDEFARTYRLVPLIPLPLGEAGQTVRVSTEAGTVDVDGLVTRVIAEDAPDLVSACALHGTVPDPNRKPKLFKTPGFGRHPSRTHEHGIVGYLLEQSLPLVSIGAVAFEVVEGQMLF